MWPKTFAALFGGCLISISVMLNINHLLPLDVDTRLFLGLLMAFPLWVGAMIWCYASESGWEAWRRCGGLLLVSVGFNTLFFMM